SYTPAYAIYGYAGRPSINCGESITFFISTARPRYDLEVYRMGWYGGAGGRLVFAKSGPVGQNQPIPSPDAEGMVAVNWQPSFTLQTAVDWVSGAYLVKLITDLGDVNYIPFVVRDDADGAGILFVVEVTTWQAYNAWGGKSLYDYNSNGGRAHRV